MSVGIDLNNGQFVSHVQGLSRKVSVCTMSMSI